MKEQKLISFVKSIDTEHTFSYEEELKDYSDDWKIVKVSTVAIPKRNDASIYQLLVTLLLEQQTEQGGLPSGKH